LRSDSRPDLANGALDRDAQAVKRLVSQLRESGAAFRAVWANRNLRLVTLSLTVGSLGGWGYSVAVSVYAFHHGGASAVGLMWIVRMVPSALFAPLGGVVADRLPRRHVMMSADLLRTGAILVGALVVWRGWGSAIVYLVAAVVAVLSPPWGSASSAILPALSTTPTELTAANASSGIIDSVGFFLGPAIAGAVLAAANVQTTLLLTAGGMLMSFFAVSRIPASAERADEPAATRPAGAESSGSAVERFASDALAGFKAIVSDSRLAVLLGTFAAAAAWSGAMEVLILSIALRLLHIGNIGVGYLNSVFGIGALVGAFVTAALVGMRRLSVPFITGGLLWVAPVLIAIWPTKTAAIVALVILGIGNPLLDVPCFTLLQRAVPEALLARVFGVLQLLWNGAIAIGAIVTPALISAVGIRGTLVIAGCFVPALVIVLWPRLVRIDAEAIAPAADRLELLSRMPIFAPLPGGTLESLAARLSAVEFPAGSVVIREGDEGDYFYAIAEGRVDVSARGAHVANLGPGDPLGEIALLRDVPRTATCTAQTAVKLFALTRDDFLSAVASHAGSREAAQATVSTRLSGLQAAITRTAVPRV
jgi:MFS family permease